MSNPTHNTRSTTHDPPVSRRPYVETFDNGPGGWIADDMKPLPVWDGAAYCHGPWFVDANHCHPGAGYLHLLMYLHTHRACLNALGQNNRFVAGGYSRDFTDARLTVRLRGQMDLQGAQLLLHVQCTVPDKSFPRPNYTLTGQPFNVTREWSEQTVTLSPDPGQWTYMGARHDADRYDAPVPIGDSLRDVNVDIIFVLFPLTIVPMAEVKDLHTPYAGKDYPVDPKSLPRGLVMFDTVRIDYPT